VARAIPFATDAAIEPGDLTLPAVFLNSAAIVMQLDRITNLRP